MGEMPPLVDDAEGPCPKRTTRFGSQPGPHLWDPVWRKGISYRLAYEVCRYCGGRKP